MRISRSLQVVLLFFVWGNIYAEDSGEIVEEIVVRAESSIASRLGEAGSASIITKEEIEEIGATHANEVLARVPGVWVNRGSGQEHLTAIRYAVYTGSGACGEFSFLEDGIPIRPVGFCNVNNLFELNTEQAQVIEAVSYTHLTLPTKRIV